MEFLTSDLVQTSFLVKTEWDKGFTGIIELINTGENLTEWTVEFESQLEIYPEQIWGAEIVSRQGDRYTLKPVDYNQTINANQGTSIIFNANKIDGEILTPQNIRLATESIVTPVAENPSKLGNEVMPTVMEESQSNAAQLFPYQIKTNFEVETEWDKEFTARLDLINAGDDITKWTIEFISPYEIDPEQLWGAEIAKQEGNRYLLKAPDYNQNLDSQQSTSITFNAPKMYGSTLRPQEIKVGNSLEFSNDYSDLSQVNQEISATFPVQTELATTPQNDLPVDVDFTLISDWGDGFQGSISITNNSGSNIDTWNLEFDFANEINNIWDAEIEQNQNGSYVITNAAWNREI
ncbi:MAG: cellulose binding domain-containing protein, partial [Waterburya sp.]